MRMLAFLPLLWSAAAPQPPIVQPGAPGEESRVLTAEEATDLSGIRYTEADVRFMQGMIAHHAQALEMTELLYARTGNETMHKLARRIDLSQADEIGMMKGWLRARAEEVPDTSSHHAHGGAPMMLMPGMLTEEQMERLASAKDAAFDRLFLELMIQHHRGALSMVEELLETPGAGQSPEIFAFTSDIVADQQMEIDRMHAMLQELPE
jgi:uncharacterized protein (DUF305 family)